MYISLKTKDIWLIDGSFSALQLFSKIELLLSSNDTLVVGSYNPCDFAYEWLTKAHRANEKSSKPYRDSFDLNRNELPRGRSYELSMNEKNIEGLKGLCQLKNGSLDKQLFFDHLLAYRNGKPVLPLLSFHDAFNGGSLWVSAHYEEKELKDFVSSLSVEGRLVKNPEYKSIEN